MVIRGRVQGVGYRLFTSRAARELGLTGYVRNLVDGSVETVLQGPAEKIDEMKKILARGPAFAKVEETTEVAMHDAELHGGFSILG